MTDNDFRKEIMDHTNKEFEFFTKFQNIVVELSDAMHEIFVRNSIPYCSMYGTLLGLVRDNGVIPWDSDCDVVIPVDEAERAYALLEKELPPDMYAVSNFSYPSFRYNQIRVCKKGYNHALHVDIYYCYGIPENPGELRRFGKKAASLYRMKSKKNESYSATDSKVRNFFRKAIITKNKIKYFLISNKSINRKSQKLFRKYPLKDAVHCACFSEEFHPLEKCRFGKPVEFEYDGHKLMVPEDSKYFLESFFGDYMQYMPFEERYREYQKALKSLHKIENEKTIEG